MNSPAQRSKHLLESMGYMVAVTEHWNAYAKIRQDLFRCLDLLGVRIGTTFDHPLAQNAILGIQTTSYSNVSARVRKILELKVKNDDGGYLVLPQLVHAGIIVHVHGWRKKGNRWYVRVVNPYSGQDVSYEPDFFRSTDRESSGLVSAAGITGRGSDLGVNAR